MPEFEEVSPETNPQHNYVPSTDAKPRSRRRSGGFKKELSPATADSKMGEVDPAEMLQSESLSGSNETSTPTETIDSTEPTIDAETASTDKIVATPPPTHSQHEHTDSPSATPEPSAETLAAIKRVDARLIERRAERDAKYAARKKARDAGDLTSTRNRRSHKKTAPKKGLLAAILSIFGIGTKKPKSNRSRGRGRRPQGNRSNQNRRRGGQNRGRQNYHKK